jgi:hypothetical protein
MEYPIVQYPIQDAPKSAGPLRMERVHHRLPFIIYEQISYPRKTQKRYEGNEDQERRKFCFFNVFTHTIEPENL